MTAIIWIVVIVTILLWLVALPIMIILKAVETTANVCRKIKKPIRK